MNPTAPVPETLASLSSARAIALNDASYYSQILPAILPITGLTAAIELQRWGAEFIAETFASPMLSTDMKMELGLGVLGRLGEWIGAGTEKDGGGEAADMEVLRWAVMAVCGVYPGVVRYIIKNPTDEATWQKMAGIKSSILRRMDTASSGVRICCIKFVQRVVQTQTPGLIADPRRPEQNETSLALVPCDHPLIPPANLEAEASGLLDRLLGILQEENSDALLITATLNSLGGLVRNRPSVANKIISQVLNFNPVKMVNSPMTPKIKVVVKSMEKTTRVFLTNYMKKNNDSPMNPRIMQYIQRTERMIKEAMDEKRQKRPAPADDPGMAQIKKPRLGDEPTAEPTPIAPAPALPTTITYAQLMSVTEDATIRNFDVTVIPQETVLRIVVPLLQAVDDDRLQKSLNVVRAQYLELSKARQQALAAMQAAAASTAPADDDDDYEPDFQPAEDAEQLMNKLDGTEPRQEAIAPIALGSFKLPPPEPFTPAQLAETSKVTLNRVFGMLTSTSDAQSARNIGPKAGFNRLAASSYNQNSWVTMLIRIATRSTAGLEHPPKSEPSLKDQQPSFQLANGIREKLWHYVVEDFRRRIGVAIDWLYEEWYCDALGAGTGGPRQYRLWCLKLLDGILPYLDAKDKAVLIRFLGEIPGLDGEVLTRVKELARDPERVDLVVQALHYLILMRPPVKDLCLDAIEDLYRNYEGAKTRTGKLLQRFRPHVLQQDQPPSQAPAVQAPGVPGGGGANGVKTEGATTVQAEA